MNPGRKKGTQEINMAEGMKQEGEKELKNE